MQEVNAPGTALTFGSQPIADSRRFSVHLTVIREYTETESTVEPAFARLFSFPLDPFQTEAIAHIRGDRSVMVAAPTSSGKTLVAEYALWRALQLGGRAIYTTPIKALSNQKRRDLETLFPGQVGLLTGDRSENPDAPIVVMTTEVLRNMLVEDSVDLESVTCVVFDEVHYLADPDRGTVWEEAIITCPAHVQLVCLSATIANAEEIAAWISTTHREISLVRHDERPVPLEHYLFRNDHLVLVRDGSGKRRAIFNADRRSDAPYPADVLRAMARADMLPAIWFAFSRNGAEWSASACVKAAPHLTPAQRDRIEREIAWTLDALPEEDRALPQLSLLLSLLRRGVGFHHAGLLPPLKELVERLFIAGLLSVVCATDTLAVGINMPARSVVIGSLIRPFGGLLTPNDFSQLTGRAGRRGIDERGAVVMLPGKSYAFEDAYSEVSGPLQPVLSAFRLRYSTVLSTLEGSPERLDALVRSSLRQFQMKSQARRAEQDLAGLEVQLAGVGHEDESGEMSEYLALQMALSAAEKEQKRARNARNKSPRNPQVAKRHERAKEERERLSKLVRRHPAHGSASLIERTHPERLEWLRQLHRLRVIIEQAQTECDQAAEDTAHAVRSVLTKLGYITKRGLARKARGLQEIVAPCGIVLTELYEARVFDRLTAPELSEVISWFASDANRRRDNLFRLPRHLQRMRREANETFRRIERMEFDAGIELTQGPSAWFYGVALAWAEGASIEEITARIELGEGDIVSLLNKTIDLLDQIENLSIRYGDVELMDRCQEARGLMSRGLVAMVRSSGRSTEPPLKDPLVAFS
jgi:superfamily II RNA helicase